MLRRIFPVAVLGLVLLTGCTKTKEEYQEEQKRRPPEILCTQGNLTVYKVKDVESGLWVYFTVPTGDVSWTVPGDDDNPPKPFAVSGVKKAK